MSTAIFQRPFSSQPHINTEHSLLRCAEPVIDRILEVRAGLVPRSIALQSDFDQRLLQLDAEARRAGYQEEQIQLATYALVALIDESVRLEGFSDRVDWDINTLQSKYFDTYTAGHGFYEYLGNLLNSSGNHSDVAEIFYTCLLIGFVGESDEEKRKQTIRMVAGYLKNKGRLVRSQLSKHGLGEELPPLPQAPDWPIWAKIGVVVWPGLLILLVMLLNFILALIHLVPSAKDLLRSGTS